MFLGMETTLVVTVPPRGAGLCDLCGSDPHPEHTCLWRWFRALLKVPTGRHHFSDAIHSRIVSGEMDEADGADLLRRMLERTAGHKDAHGFTGSVQELEDDVAAGRPLTRYQ